MSLLSLPNELLDHMESFLPHGSIIQLSKTCKKLKLSCSTKLYGTIYIIISTYCRTFEFTTVSHYDRIQGNSTIISGLLSLNKFIVNTLPILQKFIKKLYIDYLCFDTFLDPRINQMISFSEYEYHQVISTMNVESIEDVKSLFYNHVQMRLENLDEVGFNYFSRRYLDGNDKSSTNLVQYSVPINYSRIMHDIIQIITKCLTLNLIDYRVIEAWGLLKHETKKGVSISRVQRSGNQLKLS